MPSLRILIDHDYLLFSNNEYGLTAKNVLSMCSLAVSTKRETQENIGKKGIGFKSIFAASDQPMISSHAWRFRFKVPGDDELAYITPIWTEPDEIPQTISDQILTNSKDTHIYLPLKFLRNSEVAENFLDNIFKAIDPCILLYSKKLKKLHIHDKRRDQLITIDKHIEGVTDSHPNRNTFKFECFTFHEPETSNVNLQTTSGIRKFRVHTCWIEIPDDTQHYQTVKTQLTFAFPYDTNHILDATLYSCLPVCDLGFKFMFNANFHLITNRENVRENSAFNSNLRDHLAAFFVYLILNDQYLKKNFSVYFPSKLDNYMKHSSWWQVMIDNIDNLLMKKVSLLLDSSSGNFLFDDLTFFRENNLSLFDRRNNTLS